MADPPPNVALIVCDDQAWLHLGFMGGREIHTLNLDRLAQQSAVFTRGYLPTNACRPSLASRRYRSLQTGGAANPSPDTRTVDRKTRRMPSRARHARGA